MMVIYLWMIVAVELQHSNMSCPDLSRFCSKHLRPEITVKQHILRRCVSGSF